MVSQKNHYRVGTGTTYDSLILVLAVLAGLAGAIVGWLLKTISDLHAERRANARSDVLWRRGKYVDAVADLLYAGRALMSADSRIGRAIFASSNAAKTGDPAIIRACEERERTASAEQEPWVAATARALESVRLYGPDAVVARADAVWEAIHNGGRFPDAVEVRNFEQTVLAELERLRAEARTAAGIQ